MKLEEIALLEEPLQAAVKRLLKPAGTLSDVMGRDAGAAATLLTMPGRNATSTTKAYVLKRGSPMADRMISSVASGRQYAAGDSDDHGTLRVMRMPGGSKLLVVGDGDDVFIVTTDDQKNELVESKEQDATLM